MASVAEVKERIAQAINANRRKVVMDLARVEFLDSFGLGMLTGALKTTRGAGGDFRIARPSDQVLDVLELTQISRVLQPYATVEEALAGY